MLTGTLLVSLLLADPMESTPPPRAAGFRTELTVGELFVPEGLRAADGHIDLIVHLHGSAELMEQNLTPAGGRAVLVTVSLNGLSSVYTRQFTRPETFLSLLDDAAKKTAPHVGADSVVFGRVILSSFSAGFGGVRELLKSPDCYGRIHAIIMADSIYAGYASDERARGVDPDLMAGFLRFARNAVAGRSQLVISHCQLQPEGYASTAETADYLLRELGLERQGCDESWGEQWRCNSRCEKAGLHVFGFTGATGDDHMRHLRNIGRLWSVVAR